MNPDYILNRYKQNAYATYGQLLSVTNNSLFCSTIERPWVEDALKPGHRDPDDSCFVKGLYRLVFGMSPKKGYDVWWFCGVPDVSIAGQFDPAQLVTTAQIHIANLPDELEGCVGVGRAEGMVQRLRDPKPLPGIVGSVDAYKEWMAATAGKTELWIDVRESFPLRSPVASPV